MKGLLAGTAMILCISPAVADDLSVNSFGAWAVAATATLPTSGPLSALTPPDRLAKLGVLTYTGALNGTASGNVVQGANVPLVNGQASVVINFPQSSVTGKFTADVVTPAYAGSQYITGLLNATGTGTLAPKSSTYVFNSFAGQLIGRPIGSVTNPPAGPFSTMNGSGAVYGPNAQVTTGQLSGGTYTYMGSTNFSATYGAKRP